MNQVASAVKGPTEVHPPASRKQRIVYVRTLMSEGKEATGGRAIERVGTGQYL